MDVVIFVNGLFFRFSTYHIAIVLPIYIEIFLKNLRFLSLTVIWIRIIFIKWTNHVPYFFEILGNNLNCREGVMQIKKDAGQEKYRTGNNAGQTVTGGIQNREQCRTNRHRRDTDLYWTGLEGCTGGMQESREAGQEGCGTGEMLDRRNTGKVGCRTGGMQDWRVAWMEGCKKGGMQERKEGYTGNRLK